MTPEQIGFAIGSGIPSALGVGLVYLLFRRAILGGDGTVSQRLWIAALAGLCGAGLYAFNEGEGGFVNRITNIPTITYALSMAIASLIVMGVIVKNASPPSPELEPEIKKVGWGRLGAIALAAPFLVLGLGNLAGSAYVVATEGFPALGITVDQAELRHNMLNGDMGPVWQVVDEKAPNDFDMIVNEIVKRSPDFRSVRDAEQAVNYQALNYRLSLASYGTALDDAGRKALIRSQTDFLRAFKDDPEKCIIVANRGADALPQEELLERVNVFNLSMATMFSLLIDARDSSQGRRLPAPPTDEDYVLLIDELVATGIPADRLLAVLNGDTSQPDYCEIIIAYMDGVANLKGAAGERVRFETAQLLLTAVPEQ
jgi:hypothetical protein